MVAGAGSAGHGSPASDAVLQDDLTRDPEGQQVAKGYLQYLKVLTALKQIRDHSRLSRHAPLLPTSLVDTGPEGPWPTPKKYDGVSPGATIAFFRTHGLDELVDAYNIHTYPWANGPGDRVAATHRWQRLQQLVELANSQGTDGRYIFAGSNSNAAPFVPQPNGQITYTGDGAANLIEVAPDRCYLISSL